MTNTGNLDMTEESTVECPNCSEQIRGGAVTCNNCGFDIRTGESYKMRIKKAKGSRDRRPPATGTVGLIMLVALGFVLLAGYIYQRRVLEEITEEYGSYFERLARVETVEDADSLISSLEQRRDAIEEDEDRQSLLESIISAAERQREEIVGSDNRNNFQGERL